MPAARKKKLEPGTGAGHVIATPTTPAWQYGNRALLLDMHSGVARVSGGIVLACKNGPSREELEQWKRGLQEVISSIDGALGR